MPSFWFAVTNQGKTHTSWLFSFFFGPEEEEPSQSSPSITPTSRFRLWRRPAALWWKFQSILSRNQTDGCSSFRGACNFLPSTLFSLPLGVLGKISSDSTQDALVEADKSICIPSAPKRSLKDFLTLQNKKVSLLQLIFTGKVSPQQHCFLLLLLVVWRWFSSLQFILFG